jgi:hypothetical protein
MHRVLQRTTSQEIQVKKKKSATSSPNPRAHTTYVQRTKTKRFRDASFSLATLFTSPCTWSPRLGSAGLILICHPRRPLRSHVDYTHCVFFDVRHVSHCNIGSVAKTRLRRARRQASGDFILSQMAGYVICQCQETVTFVGWAGCGAWHFVGHSGVALFGGVGWKSRI